MNLLITGANGQVGKAASQARWPAGWHVTALSRLDLDIADAAAVEAQFAAVQPDVVINAAAYTRVDDAESDSESATRVNATGPRILAEACESRGAALVHFSTDYVFDGNSSTPYLEDAPTGPLGVYGKTKLEGEEAVRQTLARHLVFRTSWVYSSDGNNFVRTMLRLAAKGELRVVSDQRGNPTSARSIASYLTEILPRALGNDTWGTFHLTDAGDASWHEFATEIFRTAGLEVFVQPIPSHEYPTPAARPKNSQLCCEKVERRFQLARRTWRESLPPVVKTIQSDR